MQIKIFIHEGYKQYLLDALAKYNENGKINFALHNAIRIEVF
jgi:hypothetical protein